MNAFDNVLAKFKGVVEYVEGLMRPMCVCVCVIV